MDYPDHILCYFCGYKALPRRCARCRHCGAKDACSD